MVQPEFAYVHYVHLHSLMLGSEIGKFRAVNSSLSAGIPVLVKLLCLMESCNVYNHSHRKSFFVFTCFHKHFTFSHFLSCSCCAFLDFRNLRRKILCTSSHSFERSECAPSDFVTKQWGYSKLQVTIGAWDTPHFTDLH